MLFFYFLFFSLSFSQLIEIDLIDDCQVINLDKGKSLYMHFDFTYIQDQIKVFSYSVDWNLQFLLITKDFYDCK